jgi:hypothetical protein
VLLVPWLPGLVVIAMLAAAGGWAASGYHRPHPVQQTAVAGIGAPANIAGDLAQVLADQRQADRDHREAWVADGYGYALQVLAKDAGNGKDTARFAYDTQGYLTAYAGGLTGGWRAAYGQLRDSLNALAAYNGLSPVPAPPWPVSAAAPALHRWSGSIGGAGACTAKTTVTNSASSTGAHSRSVKTATKCGTATTTVTHKTSVSKTGAVTTTTTTTG